ncbi:hypothetical protein FNV43_RR06109 [Rhamnella rubrinervis]|uniref:Uncharacterized protein n=1 Tax=Rhamnella rubrinervis TaxID=2594499 RepID=A0A8K0HDW5_9ROSA|nr:hypothetical protein FNV43_RR06109 [Rhamnella rubrinervis]
MLDHYPLDLGPTFRLRDILLYSDGFGNWHNGNQIDSEDEGVGAAQRSRTAWVERRSRTASNSKSLMLGAWRASLDIGDAPKFVELSASLGWGQID